MQRPEEANPALMHTCGFLWVLSSAAVCLLWGTSWQAQAAILLMGILLKMYAEYCIWPGWHFGPPEDMSGKGAC